MINHLTSVKTVTEGLSQATEQLAVEQSRLAQMQEKAQSIQDDACRAGKVTALLTLEEIKAHLRVDHDADDEMLDKVRRIPPCCWPTHPGQPG